jgi:high frequency lysogenization protein
VSAIDHSCATLYQKHISPLARRIIIHGNPVQLKRQENADRIRMLLLAGLRAGVLFYQLKGSRWQLLMQRQQIRHQLNFI